MKLQQWILPRMADDEYDTLRRERDREAEARGEESHSSKRRQHDRSFIITLTEAVRVLRIDEPESIEEIKIAEDYIATLKKKVESGKPYI